MIWKDSLKIGIEEVDQQHKELFKRFNSFLQVVRGKEDKEIKAEKIEETLDFMGEYVVAHFNAEEKFQQKYDYPNYEEHHQVHEEFKGQIREFQEEFKQDKYNEGLIMEFSGRILTWLINHVAEEDQQLAEHIDKEYR
ncbi:hemerythrin family protein [Halanaerocella petrolearia]